jgi:hypothetical protein
MINLLREMIFSGCSDSVDFPGTVWQCVKRFPSDEYVIVIRTGQVSGKFFCEDEGVILIYENKTSFHAVEFIFPVISIAGIYIYRDIGRYRNSLPGAAPLII